MKKIVALAAILSLLFAATSFAYEVVDVKAGGSIKGKIKAAEKVKDPVIPIKISPKETPADAEKIRNTCGANQQAHMYVISPDNEVKNVLVIVENVQKGKSAPKVDITINNKDCYFEPLVSITYKGSNFVVKNSDPIMHNTNLGIMLQDKRSTVYNLALPKKDQVISKPVRRIGMHVVKCSTHEWMRAYIYVSEHPYVAVTDANGSFEIKDLPAGKYKVKIWHEGFKEITKDVDVSTSKASDLSVTLTKK
jgi:hypothetical protein